MIRVVFACGHDAKVSENSDVTPTCSCGETRIRRVNVRAPSFTGACMGPYAEFKNLDPAVVNLAPGGSLTLKQQKD